MYLQERIVTEAGILFSRYEIRSVTMDALAKEMGISTEKGIKLID